MMSDWDKLREIEKADRESEMKSIDGIAKELWGEYSGDVKIMRDIEDQYPEFTLLEAVRRTLKENFVEGFRQGVLLRLTGDTDAQR